MTGCCVTVLCGTHRRPASTTGLGKYLYGIAELYKRHAERFVCVCRLDSTALLLEVSEEQGQQCDVRSLR